MENPLVAFMAYGTAAVDIAIILFLAGKTLKYFGLLPDAGRFSGVENFLLDRYREIGFAFATAATLGSLYLSNVLGWAPCRLCWFQRIFMYPLAVLFGVSLFFDREDVSEYILPLSLTGLAIAVYHYIIQRVTQFQAAGCSITQVSCETKYTFYLEFVTIPVMASTAFLAILLVSYEAYRR